MKKLELYPRQDNLTLEEIYSLLDQGEAGLERAFEELNMLMANHSPINIPKFMKEKNKKGDTDKQMWLGATDYWQFQLVRLYEFYLTMGTDFTFDFFKEYVEAMLGRRNKRYSNLYGFDKHLVFEKDLPKYTDEEGNTFWYFEWVAGPDEMSEMIYAIPMDQLWEDLTDLYNWERRMRDLSSWARKFVKNKIKVLFEYYWLGDIDSYIKDYSKEPIEEEEPEVYAEVYWTYKTRDEFFAAEFDD